MANDADGHIRIRTSIDNSKTVKDLGDLEKTVDSCAQHMKDAFENIDSVKGCEKAIQKQVNAYEKAKEKAKAYERQLEDVRDKMKQMQDDALKDADIGFYTDTPKDVANRADKSLSKNKDYNKLLEQADKLEDAWRAQNEKMNQANATVDQLERKIESLNGETSRLSRTISRLKSLGSKVGSVFKTGFGTAKNSAKSFFKRVTTSSANSIKGIKRMALAIVGIRAAYSLVRKAADNYLESNENLSNKLQAIWNTLGAMIGPIVNVVVGGITKIFSYITALIKALTGIDFVAKANANALKKQAKATSGVAKATKEANAQLAGFDEMNKLEDSSADNSSSSSGTSAPQFTPVEVDTSWIDGLKNAFDKGAYELGKYLGESLNNILKDINWDKIKADAQKIGKNIALFLNGAIDGIDWKLLGKTIGEGLNTVLNFAYGFVKTFNFRKFGKSLGTAFDTCFKTIDWNMLAKTISDSVIGILNSISGFLSAVDWQNIGKTIVDFICAIDWGGMVSALAEAAALLLKGFVDLLAGGLTELITLLPQITDSIYQWISSIDWNSLGKSLGEYVAQIVGQLIDVILNTDWITVLTNLAGIIGEATLGIIDFVVGFVQAILDAIWKAITKSFNYDDFLKWIKGVVKSIQDGIADINTWIKDKFMQARQAIYDVFGKIGDWFKEKYNDICKAFSNVGKWFGEKFNQAYKAICDVFTTIGKWFGDRYKDICTAFSNVGTWFKEKFNSAVKSIKDAFANIGKWFTNRKNDITNAFSSIKKWFGEKFSGAWNTIKNVFSPNSISKFFNGVWSNITGAFGSVTDWFRGTFADAWQAVKNVFSSGGEIFDGIKDGILDGLKAVINALISGINSVIKIPFDGINSALKTIRSADIFGFKPFSWISTISVPQIPKLARGGIVNNPTMFQAGEAGKEAVLPLQNNTQWMQELADFINSQRSENDGEKEINLYVDGERFFRWFIKKYKQWQLQTNG